MGKRDFGRHEAKKPKKDAKKPITATVAPPTQSVEVEVVGKKRKKREEEETEET